MPADTYGAILAYNHADWYVAEVLANANCYAPTVGGTATGLSSAAPQLQVLSCRPAITVDRESWQDAVPLITAELNAAMEQAERLCAR